MTVLWRGETGWTLAPPRSPWGTAGDVVGGGLAGAGLWPPLFDVCLGLPLLICAFQKSRPRRAVVGL